MDFEEGGAGDRRLYDETLTGRQYAMKSLLYKECSNSCEVMKTEREREELIKAINDPIAETKNGGHGCHRKPHRMPFNCWDL